LFRRDCWLAMYRPKVVAPKFGLPWPYQFCNIWNAKPGLSSNCDCSGALRFPKLKRPFGVQLMAITYLCGPKMLRSAGFRLGWFLMKSRMVMFPAGVPALSRCWSLYKPCCRCNWSLMDC
jgi:hypothetical protein